MWNVIIPFPALTLERASAACPQDSSFANMDVLVMLAHTMRRKPQARDVATLPPQASCRQTNAAHNIQWSIPFLQRLKEFASLRVPTAVDNTGALIVAHLADHINANCDGNQG
jgi:hypothetical protein